MNKPEFSFIPLELFRWERNGVLVGEYHPGMSYNCTADSRHDALRKQCAVWEREGKIQKLVLPKGKKFKIVEVK
jgi:hypothetical protein